jgi:ATP-dependent DNA helicase DinG
MLAEQLYTQKASLIFTSATLTVRNSLDFVRKRLGLSLLEPGRILEMNAGSPFDYARQCTFMVPLFLPEPGESGGNYAEALGALLAEIFRRTHGRALTLFTSYDMLQRCAQTLRAKMANDRIPILVHGESVSREHITQTFKQDVESVLLGTHSFWEGVDVPGESLSCLVLARLPFPVFTDPIVEARCERLEAEGTGAFAGYSIPAAVIRFRQGFGRLIRHRNDRGIVIVADRRVAQKSYGRWFRSSVPVPMQTYPEREGFLAAVDEAVSQWAANP